MGAVTLTTPRFEVDLVGEPPNGLYLVDFQAPLPARTVTYAAGPDSEGSDAMRSKPENAKAICRVMIDESEGDDDAFQAAVDEFQALLADAHLNNATLTYELPGLPTTREIECEVVATQIVEAPTVNGVQWARRQATFTAEIEVKPYGALNAAAHDLTDADPFNRDTIAEGRWVFMAGSGTLSVSGGQLVPSNTSAKTLYRPLQVANATARIKLTTGSDHKWSGLILKRLDSNNYLFTEAGTSTIIIVKKDGGVDSTLATTSYTLANGTAHWLEFIIAGNACTFNVYTADPDGGAAPVATVSHTLSGGDATKFGTGVLGNPGLHFSPNDTGQRMDDWRLDAATFRVEAPVNDFEVRDVGGSAPARAVLRIDDQATQARDSVEVGSEVHDIDAPSAVLIDSDLLITSGFAGAQSSATSGAYDPAGGANTSILATIGTGPVTVCATPTQTTTGKRRVKARVQTPNVAGLESVMVQLAWRIGDGPLRVEGWVAVPIANGWFDAALAVIDVPAGSVGWTGYVQAVASGGDTIAVDFVTIQPASSFARARAPFIGEPAESFSARSDFTTESGAITGDSLLVGGTWQGSGDSDDFTEGSDLATRAVVNDSAGLANARRVVASTPAPTDVIAQFDFSISLVDSAQNGEFGLLTRYVDASNFAYALLDMGITPTWRLGYRVATNETDFDTYEWSPTAAEWYTARVTVLATGLMKLEIGEQGLALVEVARGWGTELTPGEDLDNGQVGLIDHFSASSPATTRSYDNFAAWVPNTTHVIDSGNYVDLDHDSMTRETTGPVPVFEGDYLTLPPGDSRLTVEARRYDSADGLPDAGISTDDVDVSLTIRERVLLT